MDGEPSMRFNRFRRGTTWRLQMEVFARGETAVVTITGACEPLPWLRFATPVLVRRESRAAHGRLEAFRASLVADPG